MLILEPLERAEKRNARVYANIIGYATTTDGEDRINPSEDGVELSNAILIALEDAGLKPADIGYICLDGAGSRMGDLSEARAINLAFGDLAMEIPCSVPKSVFGNMLGASGSLDVIATCLMMENNIITPTINVDDIDEECKINLVIGKALEKDIKNAIVISRGRGGINAVLVLQKQ